MKKLCVLIVLIWNIGYAMSPSDRETSPEKRQCIYPASYNYSSDSDTDSVYYSDNDEEDSESTATFECRYYGKSWCKNRFSSWQEEVDHCAAYHAIIVSDEIAFDKKAVDCGGHIDSLLI